MPSCEAKVVAIGMKDSWVRRVPLMEQCELVLDRTPFYAADLGGQAGDRGSLRWGPVQFDISEVFSVSGYIFHRGKFSTGGSFSLGDSVQALVDKRRRLACMRHHTAKHLLLAGLEAVLKVPVSQRTLGLMDERMGRLEYWTTGEINNALILAVEDWVNEQIGSNPPVVSQEISLEAALKVPGVRGILHGEYYPDPIRIVTILSPARQSAQLSSELCQGTHVSMLGDVGAFAVIESEQKGAHVRNLTFVVAEAAEAAVALGDEMRKDLCLMQRRAAACKDYRAFDWPAFRKRISDAKIPYRQKRKLIAMLKEAHS